MAKDTNREYVDDCELCDLEDGVKVGQVVQILKLMHFRQRKLKK